MPATLGSFYWLGFETSGLSPDKKRLALLGAQRLSAGTRYRERQIVSGQRVLVRVQSASRGEVAGCPAAPCSLFICPLSACRKPAEFRSLKEIFR